MMPCIEIPIQGLILQKFRVHNITSHLSLERSMCNRPKVIIVEGPDRVGKDSLIKRLSEHFNNQV